jgi:hypothetical protein
MAKQWLFTWSEGAASGALPVGVTTSQCAGEPGSGARSAVVARQWLFTWSEGAAAGALPVGVTTSQCAGEGGVVGETDTASHPSVRAQPASLNEPLERRLGRTTGSRLAAELHTPGEECQSHLSLRENDRVSGRCWEGCRARCSPRRAMQRRVEMVRRLVLSSPHEPAQQTIAPLRPCGRCHFLRGELVQRRGFTLRGCTAALVAAGCPLRLCGARAKLV